MTETALRRAPIPFACSIRKIFDEEYLGTGHSNNNHRWTKSVKSRSFRMELDALAQQPGINRLYTQLTFCFAHSDDSLDSLVETLTDGLERLLANFPWVAGKVVNENGRFKITPEKTSRLVVRDLRHDPSVPGWETLRHANFPFSMLDESVIAPDKTLVVTDVSTLEMPVFIVQANFINGGLLLTFNAQHGSMDMAGQSQIINLLAKACRDESFSSSELSIGNLNRKNMIPILDNYVPGSELEHQIVKDSPIITARPVTPQSEPHERVWAYFAFSASSLAALKAHASKALPQGSFVSTDDALSAFIWQSITRARLPRYSTLSEAQSTLSRNVNMRRYLSIPSTYPGVIVNSTVHTSAIDTLAKAPLSTVAAQLRAALDPKALAYRTRALATLISQGGKASFAAGNAPELDVRLSSWAKERCYEYDFGFGKPEAVRRPRFTHGAREGLVYLLPKAPDGEIAVGLCLRNDDLERLRRDAEFAKFGTYVG